MTTGRLFYPTELKLKILEHLARFEVLTTRDLCMLVYMNDATDPLSAYPALWAPFVVVGEGAAR